MRGYGNSVSKSMFYVLFLLDAYADNSKTREKNSSTAFQQFIQKSIKIVCKFSRQKPVSTLQTDVLLEGHNEVVHDGSILRPHSNRKIE